MPEWMNNGSMRALYERMQETAGSLEPDMDFLSYPNLGRYQEYRLKELALPENIRNFLSQVGLPDRFCGWRSPDEEQEYRRQDGYFGVVFPLKSLRLEQIGRRRFLIIGEERSLGRCSTVCREVWSWWKTEECSYIAAELNTGKVYHWSRSYGEDFLIFINSSLEQYLFTMAYWRAFYPVLAENVRSFLEKQPEKTELDYIFKNRKKLYEPFWERIGVLDPDVRKKRSGYWKMMCDLSVD